MNNIPEITYHHSNIEARKAWQELLYAVVAAGFDSIAKNYAAGFNADVHGWRTINKRTAEMRRIFNVKRAYIRRCAGLPAQPVEVTA
jgi:hypothetical protein